MPQIKINVSSDLLVLLQNEHKDYGFRHPAQLASSLILDGYDNLDDTQYKELAEAAREYLEIGNSANKMKGRKFSISNAVSDHEETISGYKQTLDAGWMDEEEYEELVKESENEHKKNVRRELKKKRLQKKSEKKKKRRKKK